MSDDLKQSFLAFCNFVKKGSITATDKTIKKICTDCDIYSKKLDATRVDIEFRAHTGSSKRDVDYSGFVAFIEGRLGKAYSTAYKIDEAQAVEELKRKISDGSPALRGTTKTSSDATTSRLTDVKAYTGSHKERFNSETGKGLGKIGRTDAKPTFTTSGLSEPKK